MAPKTQVNSATGIMGPTGVGKSSLAATVADYLWVNHKKVLLYYNSDGGGYPAEVQARIALGTIRVFRMYTRDPGTGELSEETCYRSAQGWWPKRINPTTGEVPPGVEMVPPYVLRYKMSCPNGHEVKTVPAQAMLIPTLCPVCKRMVNKTDFPMQVTRTNVQNKGFENVGGVFYDGLTSMLAWIMRDLGHRAGRMELKGEEGAIGGKVASGDLKFGGSTRSHVGFAQARGEELVHLTLGIHGLVVPPIFTMLTHEDVDERALQIRGPKIAGRAKTDEAPQWFGNMLEAAKVPSQGSAGEQRTLYLSEFTDVLGVRHLCKHRGSPGTMPDVLADPPEDKEHPELAFTQFNLGVFFTMLNHALEQRIEAVGQQFPDAPGLPEGMVEYGDMSVELPQPAVPGAVGAPQTVAPPAAGGAPAPVAPMAPAPTVTAPRGRKRGAATPPATAPVVQPQPEMSSPALPAVEEQGAAAVADDPAPGTAAAPEPTPPAPVEPVVTVAAVAPPVAATPAPVPSAPVPPVPAPGVPAQAAPRPAAAPPAGRRPTPMGVPGARPTNGGGTTGTPPGAVVSGPMVARPTAAAPRPPAAAPRPPAPTPKPS